MRAKASLLILILVGAASFGACAPIRATSAISQAKDNMFKARLAGADKVKGGEKYITAAQYEYQLAHHYLEKSKELQGFSKFEAAEFYALQAAELSKNAAKERNEEERRIIRRQQIRAGKVFFKNR